MRCKYPRPLNKAGIVRLIGKDNKEYGNLLAGLSFQELQILSNHDDLVDMGRKITQFTHAQILAELQEEFGLDIDHFSTNDLWIGTERLDDAIPDWFNSSHCGWFKDRLDGSFLTWAQSFLMQEVRINIWIRYLEYKNTKKGGPGKGTHSGAYL